MIVTVVTDGGVCDVTGVEPDQFDGIGFIRIGPSGLSEAVVSACIAFGVALAM